MKRFLVLTTILSVFVLSSGFAFSIQDDTQIEAIQKLEKASKDQVKILFDEKTGIPRFIKMRVPDFAALTAEAAVYQFFEDYKEIFKMTQPIEELSVKSIQTDSLGMTHIKMQQVVASIPVFGCELIVHIDRDGNIYVINGEFVPNVKVQNTTPSIGSQKAIDVAIADVGQAVYRWDTVFEQMLPEGKTWRPTAELMIYEYENQFWLVYRTMVAVELPEPANWVYFIDAKTGRVLHRYNDLKNSDAVGTGHSLYRGTVEINTNDTGRIYEMKDNPRYLWTYNAWNTWIMMPGILFRDGDNTWGDGTKSHLQTAAVDAHWGAAETWDYYLNTHGRNSFDDNGAIIISTVHYGRNYINAFWNGNQMVYGDGDGELSDPLVALDVVSHELTHAVTEYTADLIYQDQSGALNESMSDVFAMMIDNDDFWIGEDCWTPGIPDDALRYMDDPPRGNQPHHMEDYVITDEDNGGVHINSGIPNFAAYLATAGGTGKLGDVVTGIGRDKVENIWYLALSFYMTPSTDFEGARITTVQSAIDLYGENSPEVQTIEDAWTAVGVMTPTVLAAPQRPVVQITPRRPESEVHPIPTITRAFQNYPNPFNPETWIPYQLAKPAPVVIRIYNVRGQIIRTLDIGKQAPGMYLEKSRAAYWDGRNHQGELVPSGIYFYTIEAGDFLATHKMILMK